MQTPVIRRTSLTLIVLIAVVAGAVPSSLATHPRIINGTPVDPEQSGHVYLVGHEGRCSRALLTKEWVLSCRHCIDLPDVLDPSQLVLQMGSQQTRAARIVAHATLKIVVEKGRCAANSAAKATDSIMRLRPMAATSSSFAACRGPHFPPTRRAT